MNEEIEQMGTAAAADESTEASSGAGVPEAPLPQDERPGGGEPEADEAARAEGGAEADEEPAAGDAPGEEASPDPLLEIRDRLDRLAEDSEKYHLRAERREAVIDKMNSELGQLRRGERRSLLRPLIAEVCRMRDDLLRQASTLPEDFDRKAAAGLLASYAASLELALEDNGVSSFAPEVGEPFQARTHHATGKEPTADPALAGTVASVTSPGYLDVEGDAIVAAARVVVYAADPGVEPEADGGERENPEPAPTGDDA